MHVFIENAAGTAATTHYFTAPQACRIADVKAAASADPTGTGCVVTVTLDTTDIGTATVANGATVSGAYAPISTAGAGNTDIPAGSLVKVVIGGTTASVAKAVAISLDAYALKQV